MLKEKSFGIDINKIRLLFILILLSFIVSCRRERPQTTVLTQTATATATASEVAVDPTIAAVLAQSTSIPEQITAIPIPTVSSESICNFPDGWIVYTVQPNDTLFAIATELDIPIGDIKSANCKLDDVLAIGETLYLPQLPPISQLLPANTQLTVPENLSQEIIETVSQELPEGFPQELAFFGGGGGGDLATNNCSPSGPSQIVVSTQQDALNWFPLPVIEMAICNPATTGFSVSLKLPSGEDISLSIENVQGYALYSMYELPLGHDYGSYSFVIDGYPTQGEVKEFSIRIEKGPATVAKDHDLPQVYLYYLEPHETVQLLTYRRISDVDGVFGFVAEFQSSKIYRVNEQGYLVIDIDPELWQSQEALTLFAAVGSESGFVRGALFHRLEVLNNSSEPICQLLMSLTGTNVWQDYLINEWGYHLGQLDPNQIYYRSLEAGIYDMEARNCNGGVLKRENGVSISGLVEWSVP